MADVDITTMTLEDLESEPEEITEGQSAEGTSQEEKPAGETEEKPVTPETLQASLEELRSTLSAKDRMVQSLTERLQNQDRFLSRIGTEMGLLRKRHPQEELEELKRVRDIWLESGEKEGMAATLQFIGRKQREDADQMQLRAAEYAARNRDSVTRNIPEFETEVDGIAEIMSSDGADGNLVEAFKKNPYFFDEALLFNLYARRRLVKENESLKKKVEDAEKRLKDAEGKLSLGREDLLGTMDRAGRTVLSGKSAGAPPSAGQTYKPAHSMTYEELMKED